MKLTIDFETRSAADIKKTGPWVYAEHPTTDALCLAVKIDDFSTRIWVNPKFHYAGIGDDLPVMPEQILLDTIQKADIVEAHNAEFECAIWRRVMVPRYGWPDIPDHKWRCSAAKASAHALPRNLEGAGAAMRLRTQKDKAGHTLMLKVSRPRKARKGEDPKTLYWHENSADMLRVFRYCIQDVDTEHALSKALPDLCPVEQKVWHLDQKMNERGILADVTTSMQIIDMIKGYEKVLLKELTALTEGEVTSAKQVAKMAEFTGIENMQAGTVSAALEDPDGILSPQQKRALEIRQTLGQSSVSKYAKICVRACGDGRLRGELLYHGASPGRWTGRGVQLQNLPRAGFTDKYRERLIEIAQNLISTGDNVWIDNLFGNPVTLAKSFIRSTFMAEPGKDLICADFAQIEARGNFWLAGEEDGLQLFRSGADIYCEMASAIYEHEITKKDKLERQIGKTAILGLGYGMGANKFRATLATAGIEVDKKLARQVVKTYRGRYPRVPEFWYATEREAVGAVESGSLAGQGKISWFMEGVFLKCRLPSGRCNAYPYPLVQIVPAWIFPCVDEDDKNKSMKILAPTLPMARTMAKKRAEDEDLRIIGDPIEREAKVLTHMAVVNGKQWVRETTYGGKLVENIVQGTARDLMAWGLLRLEDYGYPPILSVHDEVISEIPEGFGSLEEFEGILATVPGWARGCPVKAEGWRGKRYRK